MEKLDLLVVVTVVASKLVRNVACFRTSFGRNSFAYGMNDPGPTVERNAFHDTDFHRGASASSVPQTLVLRSNF
jgi:hypothetical protein